MGSWEGIEYGQLGDAFCLFSRDFFRRQRHRKLVSKAFAGLERNGNFIKAKRLFQKAFDRCVNFRYQNLLVR